MVGTKFIENLTDKINSSERTKVVLATFSSVLKMEMKFIDLFKDLGLSFYMLGIIGGLQAIIDLPTSFKSVVVTVMFMSVFVPSLLSSMHLAVNNPMMIFGASSDKKNAPKMIKYISVPLCFLLSMTNQIFLTCLYEENKEKARKLAQKCDPNVIKTMTWCRNIKQQIIKFAQLELG